MQQTCGFRPCRSQRSEEYLKELLLGQITLHLSQDAQQQLPNLKITLKCKEMGVMGQRLRELGPGKSLT